MSSLSHSMKVRSGIAPFPIGTVSVSLSLVEDKAADMLRQVARHPDHLIRQRDHTAAVADRTSPARSLSRTCSRFDRIAVTAPYGAGHQAGDVFGQGPSPCRPRAPPCAAGSGSPWRTRPACSRPYSLVDVLDHLLAPLVLEIDVDIGRLARALRTGSGRTAAVVRGRIDSGNPEAEANRRIRGRAPPLAQDGGSCAAGEIDDFLDGQEVARKVEFADQSSSFTRLLRTFAGIP